MDYNFEIKSVKTSLLHQNTGQVDGLPKNPRFIRDDKFEKLVKSLRESPEMMKLREVVAYDNHGSLVVICGNMRLRAAKELGWKEVICKILPVDTPTEKLKEYAIKDNASFGDNDWQLLDAEWDALQLEEWGVDYMSSNDAVNNETEAEQEELPRKYNMIVDSPEYEITGICPNIQELYYKDKYTELVEEINRAEIDDETKAFLLDAATRHLSFNYQNIAEFYAHANKQVQELMEQSALVIIDYDSAIAKGFVDVNKKMEQLFNQDINFDDNEA